MIVVTGGAGFIGSCILAKLNERGRDDLLVVDELATGDGKAENLKSKRYRSYEDKEDFLKKVLSNEVDPSVDTVIHMGACSATMGFDEAYYQKNNFEYTRDVARWCLRHGVRFIYASSASTYGDGAQGYSDDEAMLGRYRPLNFYGESKHKFDLWALEQGVLDRIVGLKFFNVYGPNEYHKGDMRSVVNKAYPRVVADGRISLFKSYHPDYADGEQKRDFIYVKDAVDMTLFFLDHPDLAGIYNIGTGQARSWNDVAAALFSAVGKPLRIDYVEMPPYLRPRYQYFTEAPMEKIRSAGYDRPFTTLEDGVFEYVRSYLNPKTFW